MKLAIVGIAVAALVFVALFAMQSSRQELSMSENFPTLDATELGANATPTPDGELETATFGSGCFWCTEAVFRLLPGVKSAVSGYSGGAIANPTYEQVCSGRSGHAEVVHVTFDPKVVSFARLLEAFWRSHDPTTLNRQGNDSGPQYRSAIFYHSERQRELAEMYKRKIDAAGVFRSPVVTEITPFSEFFPAEAYHQDYYAANPNEGYCRVIIGPKVEKLRKVFANDRAKE